MNSQDRTETNRLSFSDLLSLMRGLPWPKLSLITQAGWTWPFRSLFMVVL